MKVTNKTLIPEIEASRARLETNPDMAPGEAMTPQLAAMLYTLAERYSQKWNFRHYSYREDMVAEATAVMCDKWNRFDLEKSQNPFSYFTMIAHRSFIGVIGKEHKLRDLRDDLNEIHGGLISANRQNEDLDAAN